ncbi:hypothetical protein BAE44_0017365 [Dichanthelium oligosanthes]|uniref:AP2/ERF domain-containing protein n=1 Tax=Dichanthelium oligosanthes TaxID=888268 RepID=A0A1E5V8Y2_9POAL|nr:hypothetical protein BAE44_0017365 [Dichanthelium oligosanthes]
MPATGSSSSTPAREREGARHAYAPSPLGQGKYRGVRRRRWGRWVSEIRRPNSRERIWLGSFDTPEKAARAFDAALVCLRGPGAADGLNFPGSPPNVPRTSDSQEVCAASVSHANHNDDGGAPLELVAAVSRANGAVGAATAAREASSAATPGVSVESAAVPARPQVYAAAASHAKQAAAGASIPTAAAPEAAAMTDPTTAHGRGLPVERVAVPAPLQVSLERLDWSANLPPLYSPPTVTGSHTYLPILTAAAPPDDLEENDDHPCNCLWSFDSDGSCSRH